MSTRRASTCPADALRFLTQQLLRHRRAIGSRWQRLSAGRQALLTLAHLRMGHTYARLAAGFGIGTTTAYRYVTEAVELLAALTPSLADAVRTASLKAYVILEGTLVPIDRIAADRPFSSGRHKKHEMNVQVIADPFRPAAVGFTGPARRRPRHPRGPRARHRRRPRRGRHPLLGRKGVPRCRRHGPHHWGRWETLSAGQKAVNRSHARTRALIEQAIATLKSWRILRKLRCSTTRITSLVQAVLTLHLTSSE